MKRLSWVGAVLFGLVGLGFAGHDYSRLELVASMSHDGSVSALSFSGDGTMVAAAFQDSEFPIWDATSGAVKWTLTDHVGYPTTLAFHPKKPLVACWGFNSDLILWETDTGEPVRSFDLGDTTVNNVVFSKDGSLMAAAFGDGTLSWWDTSGWAEKGEISDSDGFNRTVLFSPDGLTLVELVDGKKLKFWNMARKTLGITIENPVEGMTPAIAPDNSVVAAGGSDGAVRIFDLPSGKVSKTLTRPGAAVGAVAYSPDGSALAVGYSDRSVTVYDTKSWAVVANLWQLGGYVSCLEFSRDGASLAAGDGNGSVRVWKAPAM